MLDLYSTSLARSGMLIAKWNEDRFGKDEKNQSCVLRRDTC
jgi:hypothetical protein